MKRDLPNDLEFLLQKDLIDYFVSRIAKDPWLEVYLFDRGDLGRNTFFCALIPNEEVANSLRGPSWDFSIGHGMPGCSTFHESGEEVVQYHRYGHGSGNEPLVFVRHFHDLRPSYVEISEEFRHYHNLYHDISSNTYLRFLEDGSEESVIQIDERSVRIKLHSIRQFLAIKKMHLAIFVDSVRYSFLKLTEIPSDELQVKISNELVLLERYIAEADFMIAHEEETFSRVLGKRLIPPLEIEQSGIWPYTERQHKQHASFIIGIDDVGNPIEYTSDPDQLSNYFGANPEAPHYLTPVFFRREVLNKYYSNPDKYSVEDSVIRCASLWLLQIDNNLGQYIAVFLGDLGRDIPYTEQLYWRSFNIPPEGSISNVYFKRSMLAQFTDPEAIDLVFKLKYRRLIDSWHKTHGWPLFLPLTEDDAHLFTSLHVPLANDQAEFDAQILAITKILIDSLNESEISKSTTHMPDGAKGITKLDAFLAERQFPARVQVVSFLRDLQDLRSTGVGHRKGKKYLKAAAQFDLDSKGQIAVFRNILEEALEILNLFDRYFIETKSEV